MQEDPLWLSGLILGTAALAWLWAKDFRAAQAGTPHPRPLPGATPCRPAVAGVAVGGALVLLGIETGGEYALGIVAEQKTITVLFGAYTLAAAFLEEVVFRGYLVVTTRGRAARWAGIVAFSAVFALAHPFLWASRDGGLVLQGTTKAWFSTAVVFAASLWFYAVRFLPANPGRSLLPCIAGHLAKNLGVLAIKAVQGYVAGWM